MLKKYAVATLESAKLVSPELALNSESNMQRFKQLTANIKREFPRSSEFVYFAARAIHAMEAANFDPVLKTFSGDGHIVKCCDGKCEKCGDKVNKWQEGLWHSQKGILPYINQNGDAFPESELLKNVEITGSDGNKKVVKAFETFIGRGLFVNHASDDVEKIRGIILDASWDASTKGVDILVACDKIAYPELARQIEMGYSNDVSMGTQVQFSLCSECGNRAVTEADYCSHVKDSKGLARAGSKPIYEVNNGLNFIEISVVSTGADPKAKIKTVLAALNRQIQERESNLNSCINPIEAERMRDELRKIQAQVQDLLEEKKITTDNKETNCGCSTINTAIDTTINTNDDDVEIKTRREARNNIALKLGLQLSNKPESKKALNNNNGSIVEGGLSMANGKKAYFQGGGGLNDPSALPYDKEDAETIREKEDKHMVGQGLEPGNDGLAGDDLKVKELLHRASIEERRKIRQTILQKAYFQGGGGLNDPSALPYDKEDAESIREKEDKHMVGQGMEPGNDGLAGDDLKVKEELHRAKLRARFMTADKKGSSSWTVFAGETPIITATAGELYAEDLFKAHEENSQITNWDWVASEEYGKNLIRAVKELGIDEVKAQINQAKALAKKAQELPPVPPPMEDLPPVGGDLGLEGPALGESLPEEGKELSVKEQIVQVLDKIEDALHELRALNDGEEGTVEGLETTMDLDEANTELEGLGEKIEMAKVDKKLQNRLAIVAREAMKDAGSLLKRASTLLGKDKPATPKIEKIAEAKEEAKAKIDEAEDKLDEAEAKLEGKEEEKKEEKKEASLAARKASRYALASELSKLYNLTDSDMVGEAHPSGGTDVADIEGDAHVETVKEQQEADLEVAEKQPRGELVAKTSVKTVVAEKPMCEKCNKPNFACDCTKVSKKEEKKEEPKAEEKKEEKKATLSDRRSLRHEAIKGLMSKAEVDGAAKAYYKELFNESSSGNSSDPAAKSFGKEMTDEFAGKKSTAESHELKNRMKRAYKVALRQQEIGQIEKTAESLESQVERLVAMDTPGFEAFEDVIEHTNVVKDAKVDKPLKKSAGAIRVGLVDSDNQENLTDKLNKLNWR